MADLTDGIIPARIVEQSIKDYKSNSLIIYLKNHFDSSQVEKVATSYKIGTSDYPWSGAAILWRIDNKGICRGGETKLISESGRATTCIDVEAKDSCCLSWSHLLFRQKLERAGKTLPEWLVSYLSNDDIVTTFFGEHLLSLEDNIGREVGIVKDPESAMVAALCFPDLVWLATGSLSDLHSKSLKILNGRTVLLFPDPPDQNGWTEIRAALPGDQNIVVSDWMANALPIDECNQGFSFARFLLSPPSTGEQPLDSPKLIRLQSENIKKFMGSSHTGDQFGNMIIQGIATKDGKVFDLLYDSNHDLVRPGEKEELIRQLSGFYEKHFVAGVLDDFPCFIHVDRNFK